MENRDYREDNQYKYHKGICNDAYMIYMFEEEMTYNDRKFFYDLMNESQVECDKIKKIYNL